MTRRTLLELLTAAKLARGFRLAVCNETFQTADFGEQCRLARKTGYSGIEIMPGTLAEDPASIPASRRAQLRKTMDAEGLAFAGLHNLLSAPKGLHAATADAAVYRRTWDYMLRLIDFCADLGGGVMVFGGAKQRAAEKGETPAGAVARLTEGFARVAPHARGSGVLLLVEPLAPHICNVVNTLEQAIAIVRQIGSPAVQSMFDVHHTAAETLSAGELVARYFPYLRHVHLNEMDGKRPGLGNYDMKPLFRAMAQRGYAGWLSLEVFDFKPDGETVAAEANAYIRSELAKA
ncbi:MAG: sugar phosphate isomerase/epimerase family protein [Bryobacteraceae bacterium]